MSKQEANLQQVIDMCDKVGWSEGISALEKIVLGNENLQAELYSSPETIKQAQMLSKTIVAQNMTIARLKQIKKERGL